MSGPKKTSIPPKIGISSCKGCKEYPTGDCHVNRVVIVPYLFNGHFDNHKRFPYKTLESKNYKYPEWCWFKLEEIAPLGELAEELYE
jgi:hypothetical protein